MGSRNLAKDSGAPGHYKLDRWPPCGRGLCRRLAGLGAVCGENGHSLLCHLGQGGSIFGRGVKSEGANPRLAVQILPGQRI